MAKRIFAIAGQVNVVNAVPSVDLLYGPYDSVDDALNSIDAALLGPDAVGRHIGIRENGKVVDYAYQIVSTEKDENGNKTYQCAFEPIAANAEGLQEIKDILEGKEIEKEQIEEDPEFCISSKYFSQVNTIIVTTQPTSYQKQITKGLPVKKEEEIKITIVTTGKSFIKTFYSEKELILGDTYNIHETIDVEGTVTYSIIPPIDGYLYITHPGDIFLYHDIKTKGLIQKVEEITCQLGDIDNITEEEIISILNQ